jgi:hypothetical protein
VKALPGRGNLHGAANKLLAPALDPCSLAERRECPSRGAQPRSGSAWLLILIGYSSRFPV